MAAKNPRQRVLQVVTDIRRLTAVIQGRWKVGAALASINAPLPEDRRYYWEALEREALELERYARELKYLAQTNLARP